MNNIEIRIDYRAIVAGVVSWREAGDGLSRTSMKARRWGCNDLQV
jgi:hypothetical protein